MRWKWLALLVGTSGFASPVLFFNGNIRPSFSSSGPSATELLVVDGKVSQVGNQLNIPKGTVKHDLHNRWVFPSLTDAHAHLLSTGREKKQLNLRGKSLSDIREILATALQKKPSILVGFGWDQNLWPNKSFPDISFLDSLSKEIPIILFRIDGHAAWTNSLALKRSGLWKIQKKEGIKKGIVVDLGIDKLEKLIPPSSEKEMEKEIKSVVNLALKQGFTSLHDAGISKREFETLKRTIEKENLPFRFYEMASSTDKKELEQVLKSGPQENLLNSRLSRRAVKFFLDGALGSRGALFDSPYEDAPAEKGIQILTEVELEELVRLSDRHGFQVAVHAIGTKANEIAVSVFEKIWGPQTAAKRPRIEHAQVLSESLIHRMSKLGVIASMQPVHCSSDSAWIVDRIGKKRARFSYPWQSLLEAKIPLAFGTDSPIEELTPWPGLFSSVTRRSLDLNDKQIFFPEEKISLQEAFTAFTEGSAFSAFQENILGSLEPGKWADFIVVNRDLLELTPEKILQQEVEATFFAGNEVYKKN